MDNNRKQRKVICFHEDLMNMEVYEDVDNEIFKVINNFQSSVTPQSTKMQTESYKALEVFLEENILSTKIEKSTNKYSGKFLNFYNSLQNKKGKPILLIFQRIWQQTLSMTFE